MTNIYSNTHGSVVKALTDFCKEALTLDLSDDVGFINLDARKELSDGSLPNHDIIGLTQFAMSQEDTHLWQVHFLIGISTLNDPNLFRLRDLTNMIFNQVIGGEQLKYYNADTAQEVSWIYITPDTNLIPTHRVETRPFNFIQVQGLLNPFGAIQTDPQQP